jgi:transcriptional regulator with XRE-family HTH domain
MESGERIKEFRKEKGLTQRELANAIKYSDAYLSEIERGVSKPSRDFLIKLTETYGVSSDYILYGSEDEQKKYLIVKEAEAKYEILPTSTKKLLDNVKEILESENEVMIDALKANIKAFLEAIRINKKENENKEGD